MDSHRAPGILLVMWWVVGEESLGTPAREMKLKVSTNVKDEWKIDPRVLELEESFKQMLYNFNVVKGVT